MKISLSFLCVLLLGGTVIYYGCKKDGGEEKNEAIVHSFDDLQVPSTFTFRNTEEVVFNFNIVYQGMPEDAVFTIAVYNDYPMGGGEVLCKGIAGYNKDYESRLNIPAYLDKVWIMARYGNRVMEVREVLLEEGFITVNLGEDLNGNLKLGPNSDPPDCNTGCTISYPGVTNQNIDVNDGDVVCIPEGAQFNGKVTFTGGSGTLKICGTLTSNKIDQWSGTATITVGENGIFSCSNYQIWSPTSQFINYGDSLDFNNSTISLSGTFENHGDVYLKGFDIYTGGILLNTGVMHLSNKLLASDNGTTVTNDGEIYAQNHVEFSSNSTLINNCRIETTKKFLVYSNLTQNGYIKASNKAELNGNTIHLGAGSLMDLEDLEVGCDIVGPTTTYARIDVADETEIWSGNSITNNVDICDADGIESMYGTLGPNVTQCAAYIPPSGNCNPGAGTPSDPDSDGDGVTDSNDDYPYDPERAYNNYYPNPGTWGTHAFEDLWPMLGDYDFNDLVISYQYNAVTNADNHCVDVIGKYKIMATGASLDNGFGFVLPVGQSHVASVTGQTIEENYISLNSNGTESAQNDAVIIVYDNVTAFLGGTPMVNVTPNGNTKDADTSTVTVTFVTPQSSVGSAPYNPFMIIDLERGKELHMIDHDPTDLVNGSYFGTGDDASVPGSGIYYRTGNQLPWVVDVPDDFDHMIERKDIITGYLKFVQWAQSGGTVYQDWYLDLPGYRNSALIY